MTKRVLLLAKLAALDIHLEHAKAIVHELGHATFIDADEALAWRDDLVSNLNACENAVNKLRQLVEI